MEKQKALDRITREIEKCSECKKDKIGIAVPGEGNPNADIVFLGEAPGKQEAKAGRPFIGRSGKLLRLLIKEISLDEKDVYITSPVKYLPKRGTPNRSEIKHGKIHLLKQLEIINPKIIVLLGSTACKALLDEPISVTKEHGKMIKRTNKTYFITFHPSAALRFPKIKTLILEDFKKLKLIIKTH